MLGSAAPASASIHTSTSSATPSSPTRPSRLRGLSYLRNYTHHHLHGSATGTPPPAHLAAPASPRSEPRHSPHTTSSPTAASARDSASASAKDGAASPPASGIQSGENGWLPTVQGRSGLSREGVNLTSTSTDSAQPEPPQSTTAMPLERQRQGVSSARSTPSVQPDQAAAVQPLDSSTPATVSTSTSSKEKDQLPTIRFIPHVETRSSRPSLHFTAVSRTLKNPNTIVRVGRYSERDTAHADENTLPVGFKSKVVSRRHCEFWCTNGQWHVKDVKSSSGTFLNHVRLSSPGVESRPYPVNDGDVVQLGIDFKGGEEVIFRCVKIRIECNRNWQKSLNNFNTSTHKRLLKTALGASTSSKKANGTRNRDSDAASVASSECSICLNPVAPCQALFVAPCSHVWHYKCVRNLIHGASWPNFLCPNCRFVADLEADVEPTTEDEEEAELFEQLTDEPAAIDEGGESALSPETGVSSDDAAGGAAGSASATTSEDDRDLETTALADEPGNRSDSAVRSANISDEELAGLISNASLSTHTPARATVSAPAPEPADCSSPSATATAPVLISKASSKQRAPASVDLTGAHPRSATPTSTAQFALAAGLNDGGISGDNGPMTPRNDAGPFVLDGSGGRDGDGDSEHSTTHQPVAEESDSAASR